MRQLGRDNASGDWAVQGKRQSLVKATKRTPQAVVTEKPIVAQSATSTAPLWVTNTQTHASTAPIEPNTGTIHVVTEDEYCEIYVDGAVCGNSPATLRLPQGEHWIQVKRDGWRDYHREVFLGAGANLSLRPLLHRLGEKAGMRDDSQGVKTT